MSGAPKAADRALGWPALLVDVKDLRVRTARPMQNMAGGIPAGTLGTVRASKSTWMGLQFTADPCPHCGVQRRVGGLSRNDLILEPQ